MILEPIALGVGTGDWLKQVWLQANHTTYKVAARMSSTKNESFKGIQASKFHKSKIVVQLK